MKTINVDTSVFGGKFSWNFKHIVNIERIHGYNSVNLKHGFQMLEIRNPREAFDYFDYEDNN